jgi:D-alanyl-D-alanine carboxypeptidase
MNTQALDHAVSFIEPWLQLRSERREVPGFAVAIAHNGTIVLNHAYGYADLEKSTRLTPDHVFRIASHSKTFTSTALMLLAEEGKLRIDDRVTAYLPWLAAHKDPRWAEVTLRQLMSHGAGVIRDGLDSNYWQLGRPFPDADTFREEIMATDLVVEVDTRLKYSNYGYTVLGLVIEAVSGQDYNRFVTERIVRPLALERTYPEYVPEIGHDLVTGYSRRYDDMRLPIAAISTHAMSPATGFCSTTADLCRYFSAHMVGSGQLLSDPSKKEMQRVQWHAKTPGQQVHEDYGLGIIMKDIGERRVFGHSGGFPGCLTQSMADPAEGLVVVALTNANDGLPGNLVDSVYKILGYFQEHTPEGAPARDLRHLEGEYASLWGTTSIVATGDRVVAAHPDLWDPFDGADELAYVDENTLRIVETSSFGSEGELVRFHRTNGRVETITYAGGTMWPRHVWLDRLRQRTMIGA